MCEINRDARRVILNIMAVNNESLVGLEIGNSRFISMSLPEFRFLVATFVGAHEIIHFQNKLFEQQAYINLGADTDGPIDENKLQLIILESVIPNEDLSSEDHDIPLMLQLYKAEDIFSCYWLTYQNIDGNTCGGGLARLVKYEHSIDGMPKGYSLSATEKETFIEWYSSHYEMLSSSCNDSFKQWVHTYFDSYLIGKAEQEFVMLFSILEMLFGDSNSEISYKIRRGTALVLSDTREEMSEILNRVKKLYDSRSKYVHSGKKVLWENLFMLREIVRSIIVRMYEMGYHQKGFNHKEFLEDITLGGYSKLD